MEVTNVPPVPIDPAMTRVGTGSGAGSAAPLPGAAAASAASAAAAVVSELVNIHPLDIAGALQILIAEVRASLSLPVGPAPLDPLPAPVRVLAGRGVFKRARGSGHA
jgi:hypothetical protein